MLRQKTRHFATPEQGRPTPVRDQYYGHLKKFACGVRPGLNKMLYPYTLFDLAACEKRDLIQLFQNLMRKQYDQVVG